MWKRGGKFETWKKRWFVLRGDIIFYFREQEVRLTSVVLEDIARLVGEKENADEQLKCIQ